MQSILIGIIGATVIAGVIYTLAICVKNDQDD